MSRWRTSCEQRRLVGLSQRVHGNVSAEEFAFALLLRKHKQRKARTAMSRMNSIQAKQSNKRAKKSGCMQLETQLEKTQLEKTQLKTQLETQLKKTQLKKTQPPPLRGIKCAASSQVV